MDRAEDAEGATANIRLAQLFTSHHDQVLAYCARRIGRDEAEDAAAEVFAIATRRLEDIDWTTALPWLYGIARGVLANRWRGIHRRQRIFGRISALAPIYDDRPEEVVVRRAEDQVVLKALGRLREDDQEVLMLAAWEDLSGAEIANVLGVSRQAAEQRLHRAKRRFAQVMESPRADRLEDQRRG